MGRKTQVKCNGDDSRFEEVASFVHSRFGNSIKYIADVAGGQGMLSRILNKKYNYMKGAWKYDNAILNKTFKAIKS